MKELNHVISSDLSNALYQRMVAKGKMLVAGEAVKRAENNLSLLEARYSLGIYSHDRRNWQNPFYCVNWKIFWFRTRFEELGY